MQLPYPHQLHPRSPGSCIFFSASLSHHVCLSSFSVHAPAVYILFEVLADPFLIVFLNSPLLFDVAPPPNPFVFFFATPRRYLLLVYSYYPPGPSTEYPFSLLEQTLCP